MFDITKFTKPLLFGRNKSHFWWAFIWYKIHYILFLGIILFPILYLGVSCQLATPICYFVKYEMFYCLFGFESLSLDAVHFFWMQSTFSGFALLSQDSIQSLFSGSHSLSLRIRFNFSKQLSESCLLTRESIWASLKTGEKSSHLHSWFTTLKD